MSAKKLAQTPDELIDVFAAALKSGKLPNDSLLPLCFISSDAVTYGKTHIERMDDVPAVTAQQAASLMDQQRAGELAIAAMDRIGALADYYKADPHKSGGMKGKGPRRIKSREMLAEQLGINNSTLRKAEKIHKNPKVVAQYVERTRHAVIEALDGGDKVKAQPASREGAYKATQVAEGKFPRTTRVVTEMREDAAVMPLPVSVKNCMRSLQDVLSYMPVLTRRWSDVAPESRISILKDIETILGYHRRLIAKKVAA